VSTVARAGPRILVVDDNEDNRYTLTERLKREGYTDLVTAGDGAAALDRLASEPFDLVLLDVMMPVLDGIATLARIKTDPELRHVPVVMISAAGATERVARCIELGAEDYLPKPFDRVILRARVGASLERKRLRDAERAQLEEIEAQRRLLERYLRCILPDSAARELASTGRIAGRRYDGVVVLFADIVGFTRYCEGRDPAAVVAALSAFVADCERVAAAHGLEKIKSTGDAFLATANLLVPHPEPVAASLACALAIIDAAARAEPGWRLRAGVSFGPVVAGIVGEERFGFDLWGDTVNVAARLAELGDGPAVHLTAAAAGRCPQGFAVSYIGRLALKGTSGIEVHRCESAEPMILRAGPAGPP
jgi:adenylate cyclase